MTATSAIGANSSIYQTWPSLLSDPTQSSIVAPGGQDSASISSVGQLLSNLQQLQTSDPAQLKQVAGQIAQQLDTAAQQQGQTGAGQFLTDLANKFQNIANGGDPRQLQGAHHGHHHHHTYNSQGQAVQSNSNTSQSSTDDLLQLLGSIAGIVGQSLSATPSII